jgi:hypothetical protein
MAVAAAFLARSTDRLAGSAKLPYFLSVTYLGQNEPSETGCHKYDRSVLGGSLPCDASQEVVGMAEQGLYGGILEAAGIPIVRVYPRLWNSGRQHLAVRNPVYSASAVLPVFPRPR